MAKQKMFRDFTKEFVDRILLYFSFEEILELNDLTEDDVLDILVREGFIKEPKSLLLEIESEATEY